MNRACCKCKEVKELTEFGEDKRGKDGLNPRCKDCCRLLSQEIKKANSLKERERKQAHYSKNREKINEDQRKWRAANPERIRDLHLKKYGLTDQTYKEMLLLQENKCKICSRLQSEVKRPFSVDHCHATGKVRGLLCIKCNTAIGLLEEDLDRFDKAKEYLKISKESG